MKPPMHGLDRGGWHVAPCESGGRGLKPEEPPEPEDYEWSPPARAGGADSAGVQPSVLHGVQ